MKDHDSYMYGNLGAYVDENNIISFQMGSNPSGVFDEGFSNASNLLVANQQTWLSANGYQIAARGSNNLLVEEIERDIEQNRLLPRLYNKQMTILYGEGPMLYKKRIVNNQIVKEYQEVKQVNPALNSWMMNGMEQNVADFCKANIKNYYYFRDFFTKTRMSLGNAIGKQPIAGLEALENKDCRLATSRADAATSLISYRDLRYVTVGRWLHGGSQFSVYPRFDVRDVSRYNFAAVSHHREKSVGDYYGNNETHQGTSAYIRGANKSANYINSFLKNSLAAKVHVIIPDSYVESKRMQIRNLCAENEKRISKNLTTLMFNGIDIGTTYKESTLIRYINNELKKLSDYLSGEGNQGKAFASYSYRVGQGKEQDNWKIETIDLKYKEYIESLIAYDRRADEVIATSVGFDASVSGISKEGIISKSGSDLYYNYLIYLLSLTHDDEKCCEPLSDIFLQCNFPDLYNQGYRFGFYRQVPQRQENVEPANRLNQKQA